MIKKILPLSLLAIFAMASTSGEGVTMLLNDVKTVNSYAINSLDKIANSDKELKNFEAKVQAFAKEVATFEQTQLKPFKDTKEALISLEKLEELSSQTMVLAKELAYISSHHADKVSDDYIHTLDAMLKTTLRLSDDIGKMSDRILDMADKIGVMADRIVKTQQIQSQNLQASEKLTYMAMNSISSQIISVGNTAAKSFARSTTVKTVPEAALNTYREASAATNYISSKQHLNATSSKAVSPLPVLQSTVSH